MDFDQLTENHNILCLKNDNDNDIKLCGHLRYPGNFVALHILSDFESKSLTASLHLLTVSIKQN